MLRRIGIFALMIVLLVSPAAAQDGLNLPSELFVLTNAGVVQRYGLGAAGVAAVTPEDAFVVDFAAAPDGGWLAYRTENGLELLNLNTGESETIEAITAGLPMFRGRGDTMAWSPGGDALAYTTAYGARVWFNAGAPAFADLRQGQFEQVMWSPDGSYLAAEAEPSIWWLYRREGTSLTLTSAIPSSAGLAWINATEIVFAPEEGGLIRMDLANANRQTLLLDDTWVYTWPYVQPDGTLLVFGRQKDDPEIEEGFGRLLGLAPDAPRVSSLGEVAVELRYLRWTPGGELMMAFKGGVLALVIPTTGQGLALPVSDVVTYAWGPTPPEQVDRLPLPADGFFITDDENGSAQVWRLPANGEMPVMETAAEADVTAYAVAPGGSRLAYATGGRLWLQSLAGAAPPEELSDLDGRDIFDIAFSPDGQRLVFATTTDSQNVEGGIWVQRTDGTPAGLIQPNGPDAATFAPPFYRQPAFAPDGVALLVLQGGSETTGFRLLSEAGNDASRQDFGQFDAALWLQDGRILAYGNGIGIGDPPPTQPIVIYNPADGMTTPLASIPYPARIETLREIAPGQVRLVLGSAQTGPRPLNVVDLRLDTGQLSPVGSGGYMRHPALSPDGRWLAGQTAPDGRLTFRELQNGRQVVLSSPTSARAFRWTSIR
ncbi:MAG: PD40 domain-containing protein [Chloroflexi bacterium]|nr:PD40 domain-containing protein [Chloroflexota bacterium]